AAPRLIGAYYGGFGNAPDLKTPQARQYESSMKKWYGPAGFNVTDSFVYNYYNAAHALVIGLQKSGGALGSKLQAALPRSIKAGYQVSNGGIVKLASNRPAITDRYTQQLATGPAGTPAATIGGCGPDVR